MRVIESLAHLFSSLGSIQSKFVYYDGNENYKQEGHGTLNNFSNYNLTNGFLDGKDIQHNLEVLSILKGYESKLCIINIETGHKRYWKVSVQLDGNVVFKDKIVFTSSNWLMTLIGRLLYRV